MTSNDRKERSLAQNCMWILESELQWEYLEILDMISHPFIRSERHMNAFLFQYKRDVTFIADLTLGHQIKISEIYPL